MPAHWFADAQGWFQVDFAPNFQVAQRRALKCRFTEIHTKESLFHRGSGQADSADGNAVARLNSL